MAESLNSDYGPGILTLVQGEVSEKQFWALLSMYPSKYNEYERKVSEAEEISITKYGRIIESGYGGLPPKEQQEFLIKKYADLRHQNGEKR